MDGKCAITSINGPVEIVLGYTPEEMIGACGFDFIHPDDLELTMNAFAWTLTHPGSARMVEYRLRHKTGKWVAVEAVGTNWLHDPVMNGIVVNIRDISARKNAEQERSKLQEQLQQAMKMEAIGRLAGGVAHDFNNVLMAIQGNVSLMLLDCDPGHDLFPRLRNIEKQVASGSRLTSRLLGYARKEPQQWRAVQINRLVRDSAETFGRTRKDLSIELCLDENLAPVHGDPDQVEQILWNLFINASDAMPQGGRIQVTTKNASREEMAGRNLPKPGPYVMLSVADSGMGIDPETIAHIFEPFFTTKAAGKGTGLGLASVYGIVKTHGGHIDAESENGLGAVFHVFLPAGQAEGVEASVAPHCPVRGTGTILLVDDEESVRSVGEEMLTRLGYVVHPAAGGREALEIFRRYKDRIDGVILDLVMPEMSGSKVFEELRQVSPAVRILLSSGFDEDERAAPLLMCGGAAFMQKPFTLDRLSEMLTSLLKPAAK